MIGDIVGKPGRRIVLQAMNAFRERESIDFVVANAENAADGSGITPKIFRSLVQSGVDCITLGDHIYRRREIEEVLEHDQRIVKPANYPDGAPGKRWTVIEAPNGVPVAVFSLQGRLFMKPSNCPWHEADRILAELPPEVKVRLLDFHAEATSEKQAMGRYLAGRVTAVVGTHTHVPTADTEIFPGGTAFQCDLGMTGPYESILGREIDRVLETTIHFRPTYFEVAKRDVRMCGLIVDVDPESGQATQVTRVCVTQADADAWTAPSPE